MATTFTDIYTSVMNRVGWPVSDTTLLTRAKTIINTLSRDVATLRPWVDLQRRSALAIFAPVSTGTLLLAKGSGSVIGTSTTFLTDAVLAGMKLKVAGYDSIMTVAANAGGDTILTMTAAWPHATVTAGTFQIWQDEYPLATDFGRPVNYIDFINHWRLQPVGLRQMREYAPWPATPGKSRYYTLIKPAVGDQRVWNILFYPPPDETALIPYEYITSYMAFSSLGAGQATMVSDDDEPWMDERYRHMLVYGALSEIYRDFKDDTRSSEALAKYEQLLKRMADDEEVTCDSPRLIPSRAKYLHLTRRSTTPRYDVNGNFDRMR